MAIDLLGFGFSDKPRKHIYRIHEQADIIEALMHDLGIPKYHILAHDYGDTVAQEMLYRDNNRHRLYRQGLSVCLLNGGLFPEVHRARRIQKVLLTPLGGLVSRLLTKRVFARNMKQIFGANTQPSNEEIDSFWKTNTYNKGTKVVHKVLNYMNERIEFRTRWLEALVKSRVPIALINGLDDPVSGKHMVVRYRELVNHGEIYELPRVGHFPQVETPDEVLNCYLKFLNKV